MSVQIIVDSTCDLSLTEIEQKELLRAPLTVHWDGEEFRDGVDITPPDFFARLIKSSSLPTTSQVPVQVFSEMIVQSLDMGNEVLVMTISKNLSGTFQSATIARDELEVGQEQVQVFDSGSGSLGFMLMVRQAVVLRDAGLSAAQIVARLAPARDRLRILACVETLKFLHKGGRLSTGAAVVGTLLSVKPVLCIEDGKISVAQKVRGNKAAYGWVAEELVRTGVDKDYPVVVGSTQCPELVDQFLQQILTGAKQSCNQFCDIGTVIGTHIGPGTVAIAYIKAE